MRGQRSYCLRGKKEFDLAIGSPVASIQQYIRRRPVDHITGTFMVNPLAQAFKIVVEAVAENELQGQRGPLIPQTQPVRFLKNNMGKSDAGTFFDILEKGVPVFPAI